MKHKLQRMSASLLSVRMIPNADARVCQALGLEPNSEQQSLGLITCTQDDTLYAALDHATKEADVQVLYARSFYAGSAHASGPLSGEVLGVLAARDPESVRQGIAAVQDAVAHLFAFYQAENTGVTFFPTVIGSVGRYLAAQANIPVGTPLGYFIAPPIEAMVGVDAALKSAPVQLNRFFGPPTETNFAGAYVSGTLDAVEAAARAFTLAVLDVVQTPHER